MKDTDPNRIREIVRQNYGSLVKAQSNECSCGPACCGHSQPQATPCCGDGITAAERRPAQTSTRMGYSVEDLASVPAGADLGLGCGNPQAIAALKPGEVVADLGSGAGFDCFLAANQVGATGYVIGVDMTPEMVSAARENARKAGYSNVEFRLGEIEHLPIADASVDVVLSNCVINLSPDKPSVYREAFRVLKPGGRLAISDMVSVAEIPDELEKDLDAYCGCVTGAISKTEIEAILAEAGFEDIRVQPKDESREFVAGWVPGANASDYVLSAVIQATKPPKERG